ncbi:gamma-aminobutyric acid receptor subunit pi-like isoform X2 [Sipha flava]|uniref:Gamma-aminobutyric acid receptor subunit pi-like isoform X2 n=1 Tax=Sipha flava TaxID=143950 RepID=A0A2S2R8X6_9HEMI|nr:gamma-aminobutyric acid receptor subunit pi-like isoform X2 [Sipha flava]
MNGYYGVSSGHGGGALWTLTVTVLTYATFYVKTVQPACQEDNTASSGNHVEMLMWLTDPCRYDRWTRPSPTDSNGKTGGPTRVFTRVYVYFLGSVEAQQLHFTAHILIRYRWRDDRLVHSSSKSSIQGENKLKERVWIPHVYIVNEHDSNIMGSGRQDILVTVQPDGTVLYSARLKVSLLCMMNLQKFPFDEQTCPLILESWTYNNTHLELVWEHDSPAVLNSNLRMTEYNLVSIWTNATVSEYALTKSTPIDENYKNKGYSPSVIEHVHYYGKFAGNYSQLIVNFELEREVGHYIMDYYVPSIMLVVVSWVSFWLDPNAVPGRTTLGTSTMLTFITLSRNTGSSLPKVSYIKATEIWFIVCTAFIFGSLVEFAFVNTIWRRKKNVELKKVNSKHIFKSTLTPQMQRKLSIDSGIDKGTISGKLSRRENKSKSLLSVGDLDPVVCPHPEPLENFSIRVPTLNDNKTSVGGGLFTLTPQEIAQWIDQRSRIAFPAAFLVFNCFYWLYVYL